jgi:ankyrin repeat protein
MARLPLHLTYSFGHIEVSTFLATAGASVSCSDTNGVTLLMVAMRRGSRSSPGMVALLEDAAKRECARSKDGPAH